MDTWPSELPQLFESDSYTFDPGSGVIRTPMDAGPPKVRRRFTAVYNRHSGSMVMTRTQYTAYFQPFVNVTLGGGALTFEFPNPVDEGETTIAARLVHDMKQTPYRMRPWTPADVMVSFVIEELYVNES